MNELQQRLITLLEIAGGAMPYPDLLAQIDGLERLSLARTLDVMASEKSLHQTVTWNAELGTLSHDVILGNRED